MVARCWVDEAFGLEFGLNIRTFRLSIEGRFSVLLSGKRVECSAEQRESLGPALGLYGRTVDLCEAEKSGGLNLVFAGGATVRVDPDTEYEAWELAGVPKGVRVVCGPEGVLSIWQPRDFE
jgi:hypothetical protein